MSEGQSSNRHCFLSRIFKPSMTVSHEFYSCSKTLSRCLFFHVSRINVFIKTLVSTTETLPYIDGVPQDFDVRSNPSTIYSSSNFEEETELLMHHVNDNRPPAPYNVISETRLDNNGETLANQAQTDLLISS